jgi:hypothetical protein
MPLATVYRAFPELDRFTDDECRRLVYRAQLHAVQASSMGCVLTMFVAGMGFLAVGLAGSISWRVLGGTWIHRVVRHSDVLNDVGGPMLIVLAIVGSLAAGLLVRDRTLREQLRGQIGRTTCPACSASLLGSARSADSLRCGGCDRVYTFGELGLESEDLGPALIVLKADTKCRACGYVIAGLPIDRGVVQCPECGVRTPVVQKGPPGRDGGAT